MFFMELTSVWILVAAVALRVVAQIKLPSPAIAHVRSRAMRCKSAKHRDVARCEIQDDAARLINCFQRQMVIIAILRRQIALLVDRKSVV